MGRYLLRRLLIAIPVLLGITFVAFAALALAPGDPILARIDPSILAQQSPEWIEERRRELGLDQPIPVQYVKWLSGLVQGDLGYSVATRRSVGDELRTRLPVSLKLMGAALLFGLVVGIPFGALAALKQHSRLDYALSSLTMLLISTPTFFLGLLAIYLFGVHLRLLPTGGMATLGAIPNLSDQIRHLVLPATVLGLRNAALLMRHTRSSLLEVLREDHVTTARGKGLSQRVVFLRHVLRNALIPIISVLGFLLPELVVGAVITEQVFAWPGMGFMAVRAAADRDPSMLMGVVLVVGIGVLISTLAADIAYAVADPRVRFTRKQKTWI